MIDSYDDDRSGNAGPLKALIYCRIASDRQSGERALHMREARCRDYCARKGYAVERIFHEIGISGSSAQRPGIAQMLTILASEEAGRYVVVIDDVSQLARNIAMVVDLRNRIAATGARLESPSADRSHLEKFSLHNIRVKRERGPQR
jgi:DNA invertase Pin-like site-specific DNA recombinase